MPSAPGSPRDQPARTAALTTLVGAGGGRRAFVDATGTPVPLPARVERVAVLDEAVATLLHTLGVDPVVTAGTADGVDELTRARPHVIVTRAVGGAHDPAVGARLAELQRIAPVIAVDLDRPGVAAADLRALLGAAAVDRPAPTPIPDRPPGPPRTRPQLW